MAKKYRVVKNRQLTESQGEEWGWTVYARLADGKSYPISRQFKTETESEAEADRLEKLPPMEHDQ